MVVVGAVAAVAVLFVADAASCAPYMFLKPALRAVGLVVFPHVGIIIRANFALSLLE